MKIVISQSEPKNFFIFYCALCDCLVVTWSSVIASLVLLLLVHFNLLYLPLRSSMSLCGSSLTITLTLCWWHRLNSKSTEHKTIDKEGSSELSFIIEGRSNIKKKKSCVNAQLKYIYLRLVQKSKYQSTWIIIHSEYSPNNQYPCVRPCMCRLFFPPTVRITYLSCYPITSRG